jgi:hypothetical protein
MRVAALLAALALAAAGCGGGPRVTETREVAAFDRVDVSDNVRVEVVRGSGRQVEVYAGEDVMDRVQTESVGGVLRIDLRDRGIVIGPDPLGDVRVLVAAGALASVRIRGAGDVTLTGLDSDTLELEVEGAGNIDARGSADRLVATFQGAADANLSELVARTARVRVQGAADADLNVREALDVTIQGAADVSYRGDPVVRSDIEGAGDLDRVRP